MYRARVLAALTVLSVLVVGALAPTPASASGVLTVGASTAGATTAAAAPSAAAAGGVSTAGAAPWRPKQGAFFNKPRTYDRRQWISEIQVLAAINHAPRGSMIRMVMYSFDRMPVADALIRAHRRGVKIQVITNAHEYPAAQRKVARVVGTNPKRHQFIYHCVRGSRPGVEGSCRGSGDVQHIKFITFSQTGAARNVVMLGSLNMKLNGHQNQYNDWYVKNEAPRVYDFFEGLMRQMRADRPVSRPYISRSLGPKWHAYVYPFFGRVVEEPIYKALKSVRCTGARNTWNGRTKVRVNMHAWDGDRGKIIARKLVDLKRQGCNVKVQYGMAGRGVRQILATNTRYGRIPARSSGYDTDGDPEGEIDLYSHQKMLLIQGRQWKQAANNMVYTGSVNYQPSGKFGDELIFRINSPSNRKQYEANWNWMWRHKTRPLGVGMGRAVVNGRMVSAPMYIDPLSDRSIHLADTQG